MTNLADLELFFGDANAAETRVYARLESGDSATGLSLSGTLTGPFCSYAQTLPATIPLVDQGPGRSLLAQAIVPDPCFWSSELPFLYNAHIELRRDGEVVDQADRTLGIRPFAARGRGLVYDGKAWVLRAISRESAPDATIESWREAAAAMLVREPDDALCQQASRIGVLLLAQVTGSAREVTDHLRRLSRWAAVGLVVIECDEPLPADLRVAGRNLILVEPADGNNKPPASWAHAMSVDETGAARAVAGSLPVIVRRTQQCQHRQSPDWQVQAGQSGDGRSQIAAARRECDNLQRDLAAQGQFAGYAV